MKNRFFLIFTATALALLLCIPTSAYTYDKSTLTSEGKTLKASATSVTVKSSGEEQSIGISVLLSEDAAVGSFEGSFTISGDSAKYLSVVSASDVVPAPTSSTWKNVINLKSPTSGTAVGYTSAGAESLNKTDGGYLLMTLNVKVAAGAPAGEYRVDFLNFGVSDLEGKYFSGVAFSATVKVEAGERLGDVNADGSVDSADEEMLARYIAEWRGVTVETARADMNGDGLVDEVDLLMLARSLKNG